MIQMNKIDGLAKKVVTFLSDKGYLPVLKDSPDERITKAEKKLYQKLLKLQGGTEAEFIKQLRDRGRLPSNLKDRKEFVSRILNIPFSQMRDVVADEGVEVAEIGRQITMEELKKQGFDIAMTKFNESVREKLRNKIYTFSDDTFSRIEGDFAQTLSDSFADGEGIDETVRRLRDDFKGLRDNRLSTIARTEIQGSQNEGSQETMIEYNVNYKQWLTVGDDRVRGYAPEDEYDHVYMHGQVVRADESFSNGLQYPTDRDGDIGDWINCRCRARPYIPRKGESIISTPYYPTGN